MQSRFEFLEDHFPKLAGYGKKAEEFLHHDNNLSLLNLGRIGETVRGFISQRANIPPDKLCERGVIDEDIRSKIDVLADMKTEAAENGYDSDGATLRLLETARELCEWFNANYGESKFAFLEDLFPSGANVPPLAELSEFGQEAEENLYTNTRYCMICLGDIGESVAYMLLNAKNIPYEKDQIDRIKMLVNRSIISKQTGSTLHALRMARNLAIHSRFSIESDGRKLLDDALDLCEWLFRVMMSSGDIVRGRIQSIDTAGMCVNIGRISGFVPSGEIPDRGKYSEGKKYMFRVLETDGENITLSLRDIISDPWAMTARRYEKYELGQEVNAVIRRLTKTLGAVVVLRDGLEARIPDQELGSKVYSRKKGIKYEVKAKVKWFDPKRYPYMLLSVRDLEDLPKPDYEENSNDNSAMPDSYFMDFCKNADAGDIAREIERGANVNAKNKKGMTVLMLAAIYNNNPEVINVLAGAGAKLNVKNYKANTALIFAAMYNTPEVVRTLIGKGAKIDAVNADGKTALHYARTNKKLRNDVRTIELLGGEITGASLYAKTVKDKRFLELIRNGTDQEILEALEGGVNVNVASKTSRTTALMIAAKYRNADIVRAIIGNGAGVNIQNKKGDTALMSAARYNTSNVIDVLLEAGADIAMMNRKGEDALYWAEGNPSLRGTDTIQRLKHTAPPEPEPEPDTPNAPEPEPIPEPEPDHEEAARMMKQILQRDFLNICRSGSLEEIAEALNAGVNVNGMNSKHITALMFAARFNTPEAVSLLLEHGADVSAVSDKGLNALDYARKNEKLNDSDILRQIEYMLY